MEQSLLPVKEEVISFPLTEASGDRFEISWQTILQEFKKLGSLAGPMIIVNLNQFLLSIISLTMAGHVDILALSSTAIATSIANVSGFSVLIGLASGLDTLCGQAFGARQFRKVGIITYSAILCLLLASIPIAILWAYMENILVLAGQDPAISAEAGRYILHLLPALLAASFVLPLQRFLQSQSLMEPMLFISFLVLCFHTPICWVLVYKVKLGAIGAAIANCISNWWYVVFLGLYIAFSPKCNNTRVPFSAEVFGEIGMFLRYAIPSTIMTCLEWWAYELLILLSGLLPNPQLESSVLSICVATLSTFFAIPCGIAGAASVRVSNELGAGNVSAARAVVHSVTFLAFTEGILMGTILFLCRHIYGYIFSIDVEVVEYASSIAYLMTYSLFLDSIQGALSGVARGCGWQRIGAMINLGAFYLCGIPAAVVFAFVVHLRGLGLRLGIVIGQSTQALLLVYALTRINWRKEALLARKRVIDGALC